MFQLEDTICAIATPAGMGGVGIVRLSGPEALPIARKAFQGSHPVENRREILLGKFLDPVQGEVLDEGLLLVMPGPHSYTGEDVVEFHAHGSPALLSKLVAVLAQLGARLAEPGEFTYRAFMNGRMDLTQAEAVEALVSAHGEAARRQALKHLTGGLAAHLEPMEEALKSLYLKIEARLEFSEDGIPPLELPKFEKEMGEVRRELEDLQRSYSQGKVLREGVTVALVGPPNVGKSSLLNALLGTDRAIVTPIAGTTRDVVEGELLLKGVRVKLFDTAGLRETGNVVEVEGIRRSRQVIEEADIIFWLIDAAQPEGSLKELRTASLPSERTWYLFNKTDLVKNPQGFLREFLTILSERSEPAVSLSNPSNGLDLDRCLALSCQSKEGLDHVLAKIEALLKTPVSGEDVVLTSVRHRQEVEAALKALGNLQGLMKSGEPYELWAEELKAAALAIGRIRGRNLPASAFEDIFTKFCIGK